MLDSFTKLSPGCSKKATDHYILYKCVNQVWLRYDNEVVKKANLTGNFHVNLTFLRHVQTSTAVQFDLDFATIKQSRVKRSVTFSLPTGDELPEKLPKLYGSKSGQKSIQANLLQSLQLLWTHLKILKVQVQISHLCQKVLLLQTHPQGKNRPQQVKGSSLHLMSVLVKIFSLNDHKPLSQWQMYQTILHLI